MAKRESINAFEQIQEEAIEASKYKKDTVPESSKQNGSVAPDKPLTRELKAISIRMDVNDVENLRLYLLDNFGENLASGCRRIIKEWMKTKGL